jgi:glycosyltransferase involved in cell wall biosynthesis
MRILFLSTWFPYPPDNGSKIRAKYLVQALSHRHRVLVAAFDREWREKKDRALERSEAVDGVEVLRVPVDPFRYVSAPQLVKFLSPIPLACWPSRVMRSVVDRLVSKDSYDVVIAFQMPVASYALLLDKIPRILDLDVSLGYQRYEAWRNARSTVQRLRCWVSWQKTRRCEGGMIKGFDTCTVVAPEELEFLLKTFGGPGTQFQLSRNGVDCGHNRPGLVEMQPFSLVYNGALTYSANYDAMRYFLAEIYPLIRQEIPKASLTITGSLQGVDLSGLALDESVRLSGYVEDVRVPVAGAAVCVTPIREGGGTRLKILEAMALGTPVVSTSKGAEGLEVTPGQDIVIANEPAAFAAEVARLLQDSALRARLATNARHLVEERYDWGQIGEAFVTLVEDVAHKHVPEGSGQHAR